MVATMRDTHIALVLALAFVKGCASKQVSLPQTEQAAVVVTEAQATELAKRALRANGHNPDDYTLSASDISAESRVSEWIVGCTLNEDLKPPGSDPSVFIEKTGEVVFRPGE